MRPQFYKEKVFCPNTDPEIVQKNMASFFDLFGEGTEPSGDSEASESGSSRLGKKI